MKKILTFKRTKKQSLIISGLRRKLLTSIALLLFSIIGYGQGEIHELPQVVDFDGFYGVNLSEIAEGWYEANNDPPEGTSGGWYQSEVLYDDIHAAIELNSNTHREWIISPRFYATENTKVSFDASITLFHDEPREGTFGGDDEFSVMVSTDGGNSFETLYTFSNNSSKTLEYEFKRFTFELADYSGENIQVGFFASDGSQEDGRCAIHLDDIEIKNQKAHDVNAVDIVEPTETTCVATEQPVVVEVKNEGYESVANIPLKLKVRGAKTENIFNVVSGPIEPNEKVQKEIGTLDMSSHGEYEFNLVTELESDSFPYNNEYTEIINNESIQQLPLEKLTFSTSYGNIGESYEGWSEARGENYPEAKMNTDWQSDDYNGKKGVSVYFSSVSTIDWLISPKFKPEANTKLSFDYALDLEDGVTGMGSDDEMNIMITTDCGKTWQKVDQITKDSDVSAEWKDYVVDLSEYAGETVRIAFYAYTGTNNDSEEYSFFLDNIDIREMHANDVGVEELIYPGAPAEFTDDETVTALVKNYGTNEAVDFDIAYKINDNDPVVETITNPVPAKEGFEYTFSQTADLTQQEDATISIYTQMQDDGNPDNDGIYDKSLETASFDPATEGDFTTSFEPDEDLAGWFVVNNNNDEAEWKLVEDGEYACHGDFAFGYNSKGITSQSDDWLFSPGMQLEAGENYVVSFYFSNRAGNYPEKIKLSLATAQRPDSVTKTLVDLGEIDNNEFLKAEVEFTADSTDTFYLGWHAYGNPDQMGMHIDQIKLRKQFTHDIQVSHLQIPRKKDSTTGQLMNIDTAKVTINNLGENVADSFAVNLVYNQEDTLTQIFSAQNLVAGDQKEVFFDNGLDLPYDQTYDFEVWTDYEDDLNTSNDTFRLNDFYLKNYQTSFEENEDLSGWKTVDVAGDGYSWEIIDDDTKAHSGTRCYQLPSSSYDPDLTENNDWLFSEGFYLEADKCYNVGFWYNAYFSEEKLVFLMGQNQDVSMNDTLIDFGIIGDGTNEQWKYKEIAVSVEETGKYFFGWHADGSVDELSRYRLFVDDFELKERFDFQPEIAFTYKKLDTEFYFQSETENVEWYSWDFGDGAFSDEPELFHDFEEEGTYAVELIGGNACAEASATQTIELSCEVTSSFSYTVDNKTVSFENNSDEAYGYYWEFGDDSTSTVENPEHTYEEFDEYTVTLKAIGSCGEAISDQTITIDENETSVNTGVRKGSLKVFPNPLHEQLNLDIDSNQKIESVIVTNMAGQVVIRKNDIKTSRTTVDFNELNAGNFLVKVITTKGEVFTEKVTKQ